MVNLSVYKRDDKTWTLRLKDKNGNPISLVGASIFLTVKETKTDADVDAIISKDVTSHLNAIGGITNIVLTKTDTDVDAKEYYYDIELVDSSGNVTTLTSGIFEVIQDITVRVA